jgi:hypothetical protein
MNATDKTTLPSNDLIPSFKIFSVLIGVTIIIKLLFQYLYREPSFSNIDDSSDISSAIAAKSKSTAEKSTVYYFKSYVFYSLTLLWVLCLIINIIAITFNHVDSEKTACTLQLTLLNILPLLIFTGILGWIIYQNVVFFKKINSAHVPSAYSKFDTYVNVLLIIQAGINYGYLNEQICTDEKKQNDILIEYGPIISLFMGLIAIYCMSRNEIILRYFITDG